jgi:predicted lipoprotein with Yx(FWY)xxD motif
MKKLLSFILVTSMSLAAFAQPTTQSISEKVKVVFPGKPEEVKAPNGATVYTFKKDSSLAFMGMAFDLSAMGLTAETIAAAGDMLWDQLKGGMVAQMAGATLAKDEVTQFKGKSSLYLEIDGIKSEMPQLKGKKAYGYVFFIGSVLHQVLFYSADPKSKKEDGAAFFDSVTIAD